MYGVLCDIHPKDGAGYMKARDTLSNGRTVDKNGGRTTVIRTTQILKWYCIGNLKM
jgi:hypothetical protein